MKPVMGFLLKTKKGRFIAVIVLCVILAAGYSHVLGPWLLTYGATDAELAMALPGDGLVPETKIIMTQAVTIDAPPEKVWPWLVQMGQDRAGFYSHERLERIFGFGIHNTYRIVPEWQGLRAGDFIRFHQNGIGMAVVSVEKTRNILLLTDSRKPVKTGPGNKEFLPPLPAGSIVVWDWDFNLLPLNKGQTRMIIRARAWWSELNWAADWFLRFAIGFPSSIMQKRMMKEIKECSEGACSGLNADN